MGLMQHISGANDHLIIVMHLISESSVVDPLYCRKKMLLAAGLNFQSKFSTRVKISITMEGLTLRKTRADHAFQVDQLLPKNVALDY